MKKNSYHGNTHGALSVSGNEVHKRIQTIVAND